MEEELERLEKLGVLRKVERSDWASPIVCVPKKDGSLRICGDFKVSVNQVLLDNPYPLPDTEDIFFFFFFFFLLVKFFIFKNKKKLHGLLYKTILKIKQLKDIRNYLQYDTTATKKNTNTTVQLPINLINN